MFNASCISPVASIAVVASIALVLATACSRASEVPAPQASADRAFDASADLGAQSRPSQSLPPPPAPVDAPPSRPSVFSLIARAPTSPSIMPRPADELGNPMPLVQRLPGGGLVVASTYARAHAGAAGPLSVELFGRGFEKEILDAPVITQAPEGLRWVWSDDALSVVVDEVQTARTGVRLTSYRLGAAGFRLLHPRVGYRSAARRAGSVLALEETVHEVPDSSIYLKGSPDYQNAWDTGPARVAVLSGTAAPPSIPRGLCPTSMSAAPDGSLVVSVNRCNADPSPKRQTRSGALRFAPAATRSAVEWFPGAKDRPDEASAVTFAASATEIYVGEGARLETWDGQQWTASTPLSGGRFTSISRSASGELWAVIQHDDGSSRLMKRSRDGAAWSEVSLPDAPADRLDPELFAAPFGDRSDFVRVDEPPEEQEIRKPGTSALAPYLVDATEEEILVLATADHEAFVLSTLPRSPVARLPSIPVQRAQLARTMKRKLSTASAPCRKAFFLLPDLPDTKPVEPLRAALAGTSAHLGEGTFEGQRRLVVYGEPENLVGVLTALAPVLASPPVRVCGPAIIERPL